MDNLFDFLLPVIFIVGSLLLNMKKKTGEEEEGSEEKPFSEGSVEVRDIKEEIRRRIQETQSTRPPQESPVKQASKPAPSRSGLAAQMLAEQQEAQQSRRRLDQMRTQLNDTRARAEEAKRQAASVLKTNAAAFEKNRVSSTKKVQKISVITEVISELRHPQSARKAVLNAEILGTPMGLRKPGQVQHSWEL